jgi:hypothetical protein
MNNVIVAAIDHPRQRREMAICACCKSDDDTQWIVSGDLAGNVNRFSCLHCRRLVAPRTEPELFARLAEAYETARAW